MPPFRSFSFLLATVVPLHAEPKLRINCDVRPILSDGEEVTFGDGLLFAGGPEKAPAFGGAAVVPEPGGAALLFGGLLTLLGLRRRPTR